MGPFRLLCLLAISLSSLLCGARAAPLRVVSFHSVLAEFATRIGGSEVEVLCLIPAGTDPHSFSPAPADVRVIARAELLLANGFELEPYLEKLVRNSGTQASLYEASTAIRERVVSCAAGESPHAAEPKAGAHAHEHAYEHAHEHGEFDPHWWHSVRAASDVAGGICAQLSALCPAAAPAMQQRLAELRAELAQLERWCLQTLEKLPPARRQLVTSHDAFGYLARDFGFSIHPLNGVNPDSEADARSLARLIDFVSKNKIHAIFPDNTENPRVLAAMTRETGARLGGTLYADGLGEPGGPAATYQAMYRHNLAAIVVGLAD